MKNHITKGFIAVIALGFIFASCSKDDGPKKAQEPEVVLSSDKQITSFVFLLSNNAIDNNVVGVIDEEAKTITVTMPPLTPLSGLLPEVKISATATVDTNTAQDFTNSIAYTVTAEDGSKAIYTITVIKLLSQKQILKIFVDANSNADLNWDLANTTESDLGTLDGVTTDADGIIIELILTDRSLYTFPGEIGQLVHLELLNFSENIFTVIPKEIGNLVNLKELYLSGQMTEIPVEIGNLVNLVIFYLTGGELTTIPVEIGGLVKLEQLYLAYQSLTTIPKEIGDLQSLVWLNLSNNQLLAIPAEIGNLANLEQLKLNNEINTSGNTLTTIPSEIGNLNKLRVLNLTNNHLNTIPIEIGNLVKLEQLKLGYNELTTIPAEIGFLTNLTQLNVTRNPLTTLPVAICDLGSYNLTSVYKEDGVTCAISSPKDALISIYSANPNNTLDWSVNSFSGVTFDSQRSVIELDLKGKGIQRITRSLRFLTFLELIDLRDNPLESVHAEVCALALASNLTLLADFEEGCN